MIQSFDIDGVIFMGWHYKGLRPHPEDVIITGRSVEESLETLDMLEGKDIWNAVFFNPLPYDMKTRESSGLHKARTLMHLREHGEVVGIHYEDDEIQASIIRQNCPWVHVVMVTHNLTNKENQRQEKKV